MLLNDWTNLQHSYFISSVHHSTFSSSEFSHRQYFIKILWLDLCLKPHDSSRSLATTWNRMFRSDRFYMLSTQGEWVFLMFQVCYKVQSLFSEISPYNTRPLTVFMVRFPISWGVCSKKKRLHNNSFTISSSTNMLQKLQRLYIEINPKGWGWSYWI